MSGGVPDDEAQVDAADDWRAGSAGGDTGAPAPGGDHLTAGTMFAPGLVSEATAGDARGPAQG